MFNLKLNQNKKDIKILNKEKHQILINLQQLKFNWMNYKINIIYY